LQALYQAFSGSSGDPLAGPSPDDGSASPPPFQFSLGVMQALFSAQADQTQGGSSIQSSLFSKFDANGDGQISQSEFENVIGSGADQSKVDELFAKIDSKGDGSISPDEMQSVMQEAHVGHHHHHHHASDAAAPIHCRRSCPARRQTARPARPRPTRTARPQQR
jgi:EF hand domain-containing protein